MSLKINPKLINKTKNLFDEKTGFDRKKWNAYLRARQAFLKIGFVGDKSTESHGVLNNATLGSIHELGTSQVPARPFLKPTIAENKERYLSVIRKALKESFQSKKFDSNNYRKTMRRVGQQAVKDIRAKIKSGLKPDLSPAYKAWKKAQRRNTNPLIFTGQLMRAIAYVLQSKK